MIKRLICLFAMSGLIWFASMSGTTGCSGGPTITTVAVSLFLPSEIRDLTDYRVRLKLTDSIEGITVIDNEELVLNTDNNSWSIDAEDIDGASYIATAEVIVLSIGGDVAIAKSGGVIEIENGAPQAQFAFKPSDFDLGLDDDSDTVTNLTEYEVGLNPFLADTDGDGVSDAESPLL